MIRHFFSQAQREGLPPKQIDQAGLERLKRHRWPGNVRELENLARRLAALYPQETITAAVIESELAQPAMPVGGDEPRTEENLSVAVERHLTAYFSGFADGLPPAGLYHRILREIEYPLLTAALAATRGNQIRAADLLGVNRNTLRKKIRDLDIQVFRGGNQRHGPKNGAVLQIDSALLLGAQVNPTVVFMPRFCRNSATLLYKSISAGA